MRCRNLKERLDRLQILFPGAGAADDWLLDEWPAGRRVQSAEEARSLLEAVALRVETAVGGVADPGRYPAPRAAAEAALEGEYLPVSPSRAIAHAWKEVWVGAARWGTRSAGAIDGRYWKWIGRYIDALVDRVAAGSAGELAAARRGWAVLSESAPG